MRRAGWGLAALVPWVVGCSDLLPARRAVAVDTTSAEEPAPPRRSRARAPTDTVDAAAIASGLGLARTELRRLVSAEEVWFAETGSYTTDLARLRFRPHSPISINVLSATPEGWAASATAPELGGRDCVIFVGRVSSRPYTAVAGRQGREGVPACDGPPRSGASTAASAPPASPGSTSRAPASAPGGANDDTTSALDEVSPMVQMRADLWNLVRSQDAYYAIQGIYARRTEPLAIQYLWRRGVTVRILDADTRSWTAKAVHVRAPGKSCVIWSGEPPRRPRTDAQGREATREEVAVCDE